MAGLRVQAQWHAPVLFHERGNDLLHGLPLRMLNLYLHRLPSGPVRSGYEQRPHLQAGGHPENQNTALRLRTTALKTTIQPLKSMKPKPNNDWLAALESVICSQDPGPEWKTRRQLEKEFGISKGSIGRALTNMVKSGKAETKRFSIGAPGKRLAIAHYRLIK